MPRFFSGKGWQLTCVQHTRRLTCVQHTKYYSCASYNRAAHEDGSRAVHEIKLVCSTQKITLMSHVSSVRVTRHKYKNIHVLLHASVLLEMSCTVGNTGNVGNVGNTGNVGNIGNTGNVGNIGNTGNVGNVDNTGNVGNVGILVMWVM